MHDIVHAHPQEEKDDENLNQMNVEHFKCIVSFQKLWKHILATDLKINKVIAPFYLRNLTFLSLHLIILNLYITNSVFLRIVRD